MMLLLMLLLPQVYSVYQNIDLDRQRVEIFAVDSHAKTHDSTGSGVTTGNTVREYERERCKE